MKDQESVMELYDILIELVNAHPNDQELGLKVRSLIRSMSDPK